MQRIAAMVSTTLRSLYKGEDILHSHLIGVLQ